MNDLKKIFKEVDLSTIETDSFADLLSSFDGNVQDASEILEDWLNEVPAHINTFEQAFAVLDQRKMKISTHSVKSLASSVGAREMVTMAKSLQTKADTESIDADHHDEAEAFIAHAHQAIDEIRSLHQHLLTKLSGS